MSCGPENLVLRSLVQTSSAPCYLPTRDTLPPNLLSDFTGYREPNIKNNNNSGVSWSWGPDLIVFRKSKKDQLSMAQICIPTPESVVTHTKKSRSVLRNNLPSQPGCDDVSFLITNCLFMLQQLPRAANKWLKECLDQAFRPLLSGGCYLVDSDESSCLVWKGAEMGKQWLTERPSGSARMAPCLYNPSSKGKARALPKVGGERKCWRVMKKILWPNLRSWTLPGGNLRRSKWPHSSQKWAPGAEGASHFW